MNYYKLIPLFGNKIATKFYLNRKYQGLSLSSQEWENFGSLVKDYHKKTNLSKYTYLLKNLDSFEKKIIKENFKILKDNKNITFQDNLWKQATDIQPFQIFNKNKKIYQGYNKNHFHTKLNLNNFMTQTGGNNKFDSITYGILEQKKIFDQLTENLNDTFKDEIKKNFSEYFVTLGFLQQLIINMDELVEISKNNITEKPKATLMTLSGTIMRPNFKNLITLQEKEKLLKNKVNQEKNKLQKIFRNIGIFDLEKYGIIF